MPGEIIAWLIKDTSTINLNFSETSLGLRVGWKRVMKRPSTDNASPKCALILLIVESMHCGIPSVKGQPRFSLLVRVPKSRLTLERIGSPTRRLHRYDQQINHSQFTYRQSVLTGNSDEVIVTIWTSFFCYHIILIIISALTFRRWRRLENFGLWCRAKEYNTQQTPKKTLWY